MDNLLSEIPEPELNETYSSLSAANPTETYLSFEPQRIIAALPATSSSSSTTATDKDPSSSNTATGPGPSSSITTTASADTGENAGLSGGAIAGIVVGAIAALGLLILGVGYLLKRRSRNPNIHQPENTPPNMAGQPLLFAQPGIPASELKGKPVYPVYQELGGSPLPNQAPTPPTTAELDGHSRRMGASER